MRREKAGLRAEHGRRMMMRRDAHWMKRERDGGKKGGREE